MRMRVAVVVTISILFAFVNAAFAAPISAGNVAQLVRVASLPVPGSFVNTLFFSGESQTLVSGDRNGEVIFWDTGTWSRRTFLPARSTLSADNEEGVAFWGTLDETPNGETLIQAYGSNGEVTGYSLEGGEAFSFSYGARVYALAVSADGRYLAASGTRDVVLIYDFHQKRVTAEIKADHEYILNLAFSPDGQALLGACERPNNVLKVWEVGTWDETASSAPNTERIDYHDVLYTPDGREIAVGVRLGATEDAEIAFLDAATWARTREFADHTRAPYQLAFSADGTLLASAGDDGTVRLWNLTTNKQARVIMAGGEIGTVAFSPDGSYLAFSIWERGIEVWAVAP